ncbi:hypothetical protein C9439_03015 [archaeon SCG-AAA382B04]|nr:hypothetical protein C9439_03015 [archaeon SCG-AAA382B04]
MLEVSVDVFLEKCDTFHGCENRSPIFPLASWYVRNGGRVGGVSLLLNTWNQRWSGKYDDLTKQVKCALEKITEDNLLEELDGFSLLSIDLDDNEIRNQVREVYRILRETEAIKKTGASKTLHLLNQELFVMWDDGIREKYHKELFKDKHYRQHSFEGKECYLQFLVDCQTILKSFLRDSSRERILEEHHGNLSSFTQTIYDKFGYRETLTKMMDEFNFVRFSGMIED